MRSGHNQSSSTTCNDVSLDIIDGEEGRLHSKYVLFADKKAQAFDLNASFNRVLGRARTIKTVIDKCTEYSQVKFIKIIKE